MIVVTVSQKQVTRRMFVMTVPHKQDEFVHNLKLLSFFDYDSDAVTMVFWCNLAKTPQRGHCISRASPLGVHNPSRLSLTAANRVRGRVLPAHLRCAVCASTVTISLATTLCMIFVVCGSNATSTAAFGP